MRLTYLGWLRSKSDRSLAACFRSLIPSQPLLVIYLTHALTVAGVKEYFLSWKRIVIIALQNALLAHMEQDVKINVDIVIFSARARLVQVNAL